ncbi:MAG: DnaK suppressor protein, partial [Frankiaceae bacterium]|nr:DnaK suppressor protein [Frankiaceae bacterium]
RGPRPAVSDTSFHVLTKPGKGVLVMQPTHDATRPVAAPLSTAQRICLHDLLDEEWRAQVRQLTGLATAYHSAESTGDTAAAEQLSAALAVVRRRLVDVEAALARLDARTYGECGGCDRRLPFEQLEMNPLARFCTRCQPLA